MDNSLSNEISDYDANDKVEASSQTHTKSESDFLTKKWIFWVVFVFNFFVLFYTFISLSVVKCIKVVGISMQPTINASVTSDTDEYHCDYVYYTNLKKPTLDSVVVVSNKQNKYVSPSNRDVDYLIKRIVALENQKIVFFKEETFKSDLCYSFVVEDKNGNQIDTSNFFSVNNMSYTKTQFDNFKNEYPTFNEIFSAVDEYGTYELTVSEGCAFVMGDNRNSSLDSRFFGEISMSDIDGVVVAQVTYGTTFYKIWTAIFATALPNKLRFI